MQLNGKLVSRATNEYAGPCPFTGAGVDRFHFWPDSNKWWCRKGGCPSCPGKPAKQGMWGYLDSNVHVPANVAKPAPIQIPMQTVLDYAQGLDDEALAYLQSRGIRPDTARRYVLGRQQVRLTIPNIATVKGKGHCLGIKKRWLGPPPESWVDRYVMEPGSKGAAIFNWNRLIGHAHRTVLIVEGVLDTILLDQLGVAAVSPFGGGGIWDATWIKWFAKVRTILVVADNDDAGREMAERKVQMLGRGTVVLPPGGAKDMGEAYLAGENLPRWVISMA